MLDTKARLKKLRGSMSQEEIAASLGIHRNTWARWESGKGEPDLTVLGKIAQKMRISLEWLIIGTGQMYQDETTAFPSPSSTERKPLKTSDSRSDEDGISSQYIENNNKKIRSSLKKSDTSEKIGQPQGDVSYVEKVMELQERLLALTVQNAELQVSLERTMMNVERRDQRIRELEKENAGLREERKGAALVCRTSARDVC